MNFTGHISQLGGKKKAGDSWLKYSAKHADNNEKI